MSTVSMMFDSETSECAEQTHKYYGKYAGKVLKNKASEDTKHRGELRVQVPGILEETQDGSSEQPLEVVAKPCFMPGFFFIPDVGAQVWVEFMAGDIDQPVWTGVWHPTDAAPKTTDDQASTEFQKIIRTSSGHVIQLDDTANDEKLVILHKSQSIITIDKDGNIVIQHKGGAKVELKDNAVNIKGDTNIDGVLTVGAEGGSQTIIDKNQIKGV